MSFEEALYCKIMLQAGFTECFYELYDKALENENPLSDLILKLSDNPSDINKTISILNNYLYNSKNIDTNKVYSLVIGFLSELYDCGRVKQAELADKIKIITAADHGRIDTAKEPWQSLDILAWCYDEAADGILDSESYNRWFDSIIRNKEIKQLFPYKIAVSRPHISEEKHSLIKRIKKFLRNKRNK